MDEGPLHGGANTSKPVFEPHDDNKDDDVVVDLKWPFGHLDGLDCDDIREAAYEIFFTACRSPSSGSGGGRNASASASALTSTSCSTNDHHGNVDGRNESSNGRVYGVVMTPTSKVKTALGLKMLKKSPSRRMSLLSTGFPTGNGGGSAGMSSFVSQGHGGSHIVSSVPPSWPRRPLTSAEIMRQQMKVTDQSDNRLRKILTRTLIGQWGKRPETIILPLELLRYLKPSEFIDAHEYHLWQKRQLKILEAGLIQYPLVPIDTSNSYMIRLRGIVRSGESKPIDTGKNSDKMRMLCNCVISLCWRSNNGSYDFLPLGRWVPLNVHIYTALLRSIFSIRDETLVLDEVDELLELMKKTWSTLGLNKPMHNACFAWVLLEQYIVTNQTEPDLLHAAYMMLMEVENDAQKTDNRDETYVKMLSSMLVAMQNWAEKKLLNYHEHFNRETNGGIENLLPMALLSTKILVECIWNTEGDESKTGNVSDSDKTRARLEHYIRSSIKKAFAKIIENVKNAAMGGIGDTYAELLQLAKETEDLAARERELFIPILKKWHTTAAGVVAVTIHQCYGAVLKQHLAGSRMLNSEIVGVIERASKLEKVLVQMVVEDFEECANGGKVIIKEMIPYEVDTVTLRLLGQWINERLNKGRKLVHNAKKTETWSPISKSERYANSAIELMNLTMETVNEFFQIPVGITEDLILDLAEGLEQVIQEYVTFLAACGECHVYVGLSSLGKSTTYKFSRILIVSYLSFPGSKQNYLPTLPPLTRCNKHSMLSRLWKRASPCGVRDEEMHQATAMHHQHPTPSTSLGTQCLYIRLNTLHYLISHIHALDKTLALSPRVLTRNHKQQQHATPFSYFERAKGSIQAACDHVSETAAYRLIFLDTNLVFYESLYVGDVASSRIRPVTRILKQNLMLLTTILTNQAQALAIKEVTKATFEAFLIVLLAGVPSRNFHRSDYEMIEEDFRSLKRVFSTFGEGSLSENVVQQEAEKVQGVVSLLGQTTEQLIEDLSIVLCGTNGIGQKLPMPPKMGSWNRSDPITILRVLCHRNDRMANHFLKKTFQMAKRSL
ncbi:peptide transporter PTR3-A-like [Hibiscus syriacus]|uniref:Peptide transporter PTR3-A-like n=1 Tax=Hibiscus syriacus TaxID=106335 RepID=A0A6A3BMU2_HIBSY|nr:peptide transporter PTR3-A-like [Hibiscus syriacus]